MYIGTVMYIRILILSVKVNIGFHVSLHESYNPYMGLVYWEETEMIGIPSSEI